MLSQISASVDVETSIKIHMLCKKERRSFSSMVDILLAEALMQREIKPEKPQIKSPKK